MEQNNLDDMFSQMLGQLDDITQQLDEIPNPPETKRQVFKSPYNTLSSSYSKSTDQVTDFDEEDVNLTAMLNDLSTFEESIKPRDDFSYNKPGYEFENHTAIAQSFPAQQDVPSVEKKNFFSMHQPTVVDDKDYSLEELSKDIDQQQHQPVQKELTDEELALLSPEEREEKLRSEKVRLALEKMKEARIQKLVVKVYNKDGSSKTLVIDERMTTRSVMKQLIEKNHYDFSENWALIEEMPSLFLERMCEEHEKPCDTMKYWTRDSTNQLRFLERKDKYALFKNPQHYLLTSSDQQEKMQERQKQTLIEEFFSGKGPSSGVPDVEGFLHIKNGKSWSRKYCVLRSSGLYFSKAGEPKKGKKLSDLICLVMFEQTYLYLGRGWKKKFKAPFEYGFALKHPAIQMKSKHVRYFACEDFRSLMRWTVGIRLAKYGRHLLLNYEKTNEEVKSQSTVPSLALSYRHEQPADNVAVKPSDATGSRTATLPRAIGVKNMFEGAWQRANQAEKPSQESAAANRTKPAWKPNEKKSNNWWDLQDEGNASQVDNGVSASTSHSGTRFENLPPPPPLDDYPSAPSLQTMPPPPPANNSFPPPPPASSDFGPSTFESFGDPLPPPPPSESGSFPAAKFKPPPPMVPQKKSGLSHHNFNNNNLSHSSRRAAV